MTTTPARTQPRRPPEAWAAPAGRPRPRPADRSAPAGRPAARGHRRPGATGAPGRGRHGRWRRLGHGRRTVAAACRRHRPAAAPAPEPAVAATAAAAGGAAAPARPGELIRPVTQTVVGPHQMTLLVVADHGLERDLTEVLEREPPVVVGDLLAHPGGAGTERRDDPLPLPVSRPAPEDPQGPCTRNARRPSPLAEAPARCGDWLHVSEERAEGLSATGGS